MEVEYPSLSTRIQSIFIDFVFLILMMFVLTAILDKFNDVPDWLRIGLVFALLMYEPVLMTVGCTLGNYIKGIRVRKFSDLNSRISFPQAIIRYILKTLLGWISFLTIHSNPSRRAIHDLASGSVMIYRQ